MRIQLVSMGLLRIARRKLRHSGIRLTVRYGQVYTIHAAKTKQPDSEAQLRMRDIMAQASALAKKELEDGERLFYWATHAAELGYKTARGACVAHHMKQLRANAETEAANAATATLADIVVIANVPTTPKSTYFSPHTPYIRLIHKRIRHRAYWRKPPRYRRRTRWRQCFSEKT